MDFIDCNVVVYRELTKLKYPSSAKIICEYKTFAERPCTPRISSSA